MDLRTQRTGERKVWQRRSLSRPPRAARSSECNALSGYFGTTALDVLIYGDTHVEAIDTVGATHCMNPGSPTYPHHLETQLGTIGFLGVSSGKAEATIWQLTEDGIEPFDWSRWRRK